MFTYNSVISAFSKCDGAKQALKLFEAQISQRLTPDVITNSPLIGASANGELSASAILRDYEVAVARSQCDALHFVALCLREGRADRAGIADR